ncbi:MAG: hypothetical protein PUH00_03795 [Clostridiales bacterium]|uniref:hypothetical protein n=1 Tax=Evtepia sp. TaxID=2773933 RepID=UPI002985AE51|nr:hypothetical protein [Evtepia sp.]MDD7288826.1 hypothetical protein [Clostridiales bacterium]MDY3993886.1 hypothetical protein [Evtepia sp.]MDY4429454.1 hypothetical protein [Evtepia sp.]
MRKQRKQEGTLRIPHSRRPQVLLLGNGLNRVYGGASWAGLLEKINRTAFTPEQVKGIPLPMQAVLLSEDHVDDSLKDLRQELTQCQLHPWLGIQLRRLLSMPFDCILTPNFTYELECAADPDFLRAPGRVRRYQRHTEAVPRAERRFMLHTYYELPTGRGTVPLFHVHGEARKPDSVILGHYFYGNLLFCYDDYLTHRAPERHYRMGRHPQGMPVLSWLDYFILGDVYSLGFGFDTSEMDLWWLLCRKKRELAAHGELYFIEPARRSSETKIAMLRAYNARHLSLGMGELEGPEYQRFYEKAIQEIGRMVHERR